MCNWVLQKRVSPEKYAQMNGRKIRRIQQRVSAAALAAPFAANSDTITAPTGEHHAPTVPCQAPTAGQLQEVPPADRREGPVVYLVPNWRGCFTNAGKTWRLQTSLRTNDIPKTRIFSCLLQGCDGKAKMIVTATSRTDAKYSSLL